MKIKNCILVLDTETIGGFDTPLVHDIGWTILSEDLKPVKKVRHLVKNVRDNSWLLNTSEFYISKKDLYDNDLANNLVDIIYWNDIIKELKEDIKNYNIKVVAAYNVAFDYRALNNTNKLFNNGDTYFEKLLNKNMFLCIWDMACDKIMNKRDYREWAFENDKMSEKNNYLTNAESCFQYLTDNEDFEERHTSLQDTEIEAIILKYMLENFKGQAHYGLKYGCWQKVQE